MKESDPILKALDGNGEGVSYKKTAYWIILTLLLLLLLLFFSSSLFIISINDYVSNSYCMSSVLRITHLLPIL